MRSAAKKTQTPRAARRGAFALAALFALSATAFAQNDGTAPGDRPFEPSPEERLFDEFAQRMLESILQSLTPEHQAWLEVLRNIDRYDPPEVQPNGDVLIRRRRDDRAPPSKPDPETDGDGRDVIDL